MINRGVMELILANNKRVEVSQEEASEFITQILIPNPYWRHSGLLTEEEIIRFLKGNSTQDELKKTAWHILTYQMYAFVVEDTGPDDEGVAGIQAVSHDRAPIWLPLLGPDMATVESLRPIA